MPDRRSHDPYRPLTPAEIRVAILVGDGLTPEEVARVLSAENAARGGPAVTRGTVEKQIQSVDVKITGRGPDGPTAWHRVHRWAERRDWSQVRRTDTINANDTPDAA